MSTYEASGATAEAVDDKVQVTFEPLDRELQRVTLEPDEAEALRQRLEGAINDAARRPALERDALLHTTYQVRFEATLTMEVTGVDLEPWVDRDTIVEAYDTGEMVQLCDELWISTDEVDAGFGPQALDVDVQAIDVEVV